MKQEKDHQEGNIIKTIYENISLIKENITNQFLIKKYLNN